jgi:hypothetical protein
MHYKNVIVQRRSKRLYNWFFISYFLILSRSGNRTIESHSESSATLTFNHTGLFNGMIYPFTRLAIYGAIWYQGKQ